MLFIFLLVIIQTLFANHLRKCKAEATIGFLDGLIQRTLQPLTWSLPHQIHIKSVTDAGSKISASSISQFNPVPTASNKFSQISLAPNNQVLHQPPMLMERSESAKSNSHAENRTVVDASERCAMHDSLSHTHTQTNKQTITQQAKVSNVCRCNTGPVLRRSGPVQLSQRWLTVGRPCEDLLLGGPCEDSHVSLVSFGLLVEIGGENLRADSGTMWLVDEMLLMLGNEPW